MINEKEAESPVLISPDGAEAFQIVGFERTKSEVIVTYKDKYIEKIDLDF